MHYNLSVTRIPRDASRWQVLSGMEVCCLKAGEMCGYVEELCKVTTKDRMWNCVESSINWAVYEFPKVQDGWRCEVSAV